MNLLVHLHLYYIILCCKVVQVKGLEPPLLSKLGPRPSAASSYATPAFGVIGEIRTLE